MVGVSAEYSENKGGQTAMSFIELVLIGILIGFYITYQKEG